MALPILNKIKQWDAFRIIRNLFADPTEWLNYGEAVNGTPNDRSVLGVDGNGEISWLQGVNVSKESKIFAIDTVATGTGAYTFRVPYDLTVIEIRGSLTTASSSGAVTVDVNLDATSVFDTQKLEIAQGETTSVTAANQPDILTASWDYDQEVTIDIDDDGTSADELKVTMVWTPRIDTLTLTGAFTDCDQGDPMGGSLVFSGGVPPYSIVSSTAPDGSSLSLSVDTITDVGNTSTAADDQVWSVTGQDSEGAQVTVSGTVDVAESTPDLTDYFSSGERGFILAPWDFSSMYQTTDTSTPVTAVGQSVARIEDISGNGHVFTMSPAPTLQQDGDGKYYLDMVAASLHCLISPATSTLAPQNDSMLFVAGVAQDSGGSFNSMIMSRSIAAGAQGRFWLQNSGTALYQYWQSTTAVHNTLQTYSTTAKRVLTSVIDRVTPGMYTRINGSASGTASIPADSATSLTPSIKMRVGAYGNAGDTGELAGYYFDGKLYGMVLRWTPTISTSDRDAIEALMGGYVNP